ncbi:MAG: hypothetical protein U0670_07310 [Anaerolineae bacterium]
MNRNSDSDSDSRHPTHDDVLLDEIDRLLDDGAPSSDAAANVLASTRPKANRGFQQDLEQTLMAALDAQSRTPSPPMPYMTDKERHTMMSTYPARPILGRSRPLPPQSFAWAAALIVLLASVLMLILSRSGTPLTSGTPFAAAQVEPTVQIVIAAQDIPVGAEITEAMISVITLSESDLAKLQTAQPGHTFVSDPAAVVGQTAAFDFFWFQPIELAYLGEPIDICDLPQSYCPEVPEGYYTIGLPMQDDTAQGLAVGDRVDVLTVIDNQVRVLTSDVLVAGFTPGLITLAAPSWQQGILVSFYQTGNSYELRLHTGEPYAEPDMTPVEYTFTAPETLPEDYVFQLIVNFPASQGYLLTDLPASIDHVPYTQSGDDMHFWFKDLEVVSIVDGTTVTIRVPQADAANLDYLIGLHATLTFVPPDSPQ